MTGKATWVDRAWVLLVASLSSVWIVTAAGQLSATYDETAYLKVGLERWRTGSMRTLARMGTMPLPVDVCTLPLYLSERATGRPIDLNAEMAHWLPVARSGTLVFWWLLLIYGWRTANLIGGPSAGRWAVGLLAVEPSLLGHAALATTDLASAACLLALAFHYRAAQDRPGWRHWAGPVIWFALGVLAKASALVYGPMILLAAEGEHWLRGMRTRDMIAPVSRVSRLVSCLRVAAVIGLGTILAGLYCGRLGRLADVVAFQVRHNQAGHGGTFLLGRWSDTPLWYYFPAVLTIKLPMPLLLAPLAVVVLRPRAVRNWPLIAAAAMLLFSLTCHIQIGVRYILPVVTFIIVGLTAAGVAAWRESVPVVRSTIVALAGAGALAMVMTAVQVWPHGLSYTNGLWGPPDRGYLLLTDSNYDWGQGLYELAAWQRRTAAGPIDVAYFGTDPTLNRLDLRPVTLHDLSFDGPEPRKLAVSTTLLFGQPPTDWTERLKALTPMARTTTFLIFDLPAK